MTDWRFKVDTVITGTDWRFIVDTVITATGWRFIVDAVIRVYSGGKHSLGHFGKHGVELDLEIKSSVWEARKLRRWVKEIIVPFGAAKMTVVIQKGERTYPCDAKLLAFTSDTVLEDSHVSIIFFDQNGRNGLCRSD